LLARSHLHGQAGRLHEAESIYQSIPKEQAQHPDALHLLGVIVHQVGENESAVSLIEKATRIDPIAPEFYNNLGNAREDLGRHEETIARFEQAPAIKPDFAEAHNNFGNALNEQALAIKPRSEPQSEPFVGQARLVMRWSVI